MSPLSDLEIGGEVRDGRDASTPSALRLPFSSGYQVRVLAPVPELLVESFRLRYGVYRQLGYVAAAGTGLDVDAYDECALPLGVFAVATQELVGTMRILRSEPWPKYQAAVRSVVTQAGDATLTARAFGQRVATLPSIGSPEIGQRLVAVAGGLPIYELSRLIVRPDHRGTGLFRRLLEAGMALAWCSSPALLVGGCLSRHAPIYGRYGYRPLRSDAGEDYFAGVGQVGCVLTCHPSDVPEPTRSRVDKLVQKIAEGECHARRAAGSVAG
jgi:GNAT superfamily N-acetyltransferase